MWICERCGEVFDEPEYVEYCKEEYNGVSSLFHSRTMGTYSVCPHCGSEDIEPYYEDEE